MPINNVPVSTPVPQSDLSVDQAEIQRRIQMANILQQQALSAPPNETAGGVVVKQSPMQGFARIAQALAANSMYKDADKQTKELTAQQNARLAKTLAAFGNEQDQMKRAMIAMQNPATAALGQKLLENISVGGKYGNTPHYDQQGRAYVVDDRGNTKYLDGITARDKIVADNIGGDTRYRTEYSTSPVGVVAHTNTPDALLTDNRTRSEGTLNRGVTIRGQDLTDLRAQQTLSRPTYHDGAWATPPTQANPQGTFVKTPNYAPPKGSPEATAQSSAKVLQLLEKADQLLNDGATGSTFGAAVDATAGAVGHATKGAQRTAQLKALEGSLMMAQPRMEGPQSDKDVALYRQMAGQIGDASVPVPIRKAAIQVIRELHQKYANQPAVSGDNENGDWSIQKVQ